MSKILSVFAILPVKSVVQSTQFYCGKLGFSMPGYVWDSNQRYFSEVSRDRVSLGLWQCVDGRTSASTPDLINQEDFSHLILITSDVQSYYDEVVRQGVRIKKGITRDEDERAIYFVIYDYDGYVIKFLEHMDPEDMQYCKEFY